jgi:hypothetical protein
MRKIVLVCLLLLVPIVAFATVGTEEFVRRTEGQSNLLGTHQASTARQNGSLSADAYIVIDLTPTGRYSHTMTYFAETSTGAYDTVWVYVGAAGTDSTYYLGIPGSVAVFKFFIAEGESIRVDKNSTGDTGYLFEGVRRQ